MKKSLCALMLATCMLQPAKPALWYSVAALASSKLAERASQVLGKLKEEQAQTKDSKANQTAKFQELLRRYASGVSLLSAISLTYLALQEAKNC